MYDRRVTDRRDARLVYSTGSGEVCGTCGWPVNDCKCSTRRGAETVPSKIVAKLRLEKKGRGGKSVTLVYDLPRNDAFLKDLCSELKRGCGAGGAVGDDGTVEIQGDLRERIRAMLVKKGYTVKG